ncbi:MAG: hypothetical protein Q4A82_03475 [Corynebacterium sp.]|nr:hypothetical protein [Corynebacterium sp.]
MKELSARYDVIYSSATALELGYIDPETNGMLAQIGKPDPRDYSTYLFFTIVRIFGTNNIKTGVHVQTMKGIKVVNLDERGEPSVFGSNTIFMHMKPLAELSDPAWCYLTVFLRHEVRQLEATEQYEKQLQQVPGAVIHYSVDYGPGDIYPAIEELLPQVDDATTEDYSTYLYVTIADSPDVVDKLRLDNRGFVSKVFRIPLSTHPPVG